MLRRDLHLLTSAGASRPTGSRPGPFRPASCASPRRRSCHGWREALEKNVGWEQVRLLCHQNIKGRALAGTATGTRKQTWRTGLVPEPPHLPFLACLWCGRSHHASKPTLEGTLCLKPGRPGGMARPPSEAHPAGLQLRGGGRRLAGSWEKTEQTGRWGWALRRRKSETDRRGVKRVQIRAMVTKSKTQRQS